MLNFCIGLPSSGKSTFCRRWIEEGVNRVILSADEFRFAITGQRFQVDSELFVRASILAAAKALMRSNTEILFDETNTCVYHIEEILNIDKRAHAFIFYTHPDICKERAIDCNQVDLLPAIDRMDNNLFNSIPLIKTGKIKLSYDEYGNCNRWHQLDKVIS